MYALLLLWGSTSQQKPGAAAQMPGCVLALLLLAFQLGVGAGPCRCRREAAAHPPTLLLIPVAVRPGFEVGYMLDGKYYVNNHLMFKILVHESNGQYTLGKAHSQAELEAAAAVEVRCVAAGRLAGRGQSACC